MDFKIIKQDKNALFDREDITFKATGTGATPTRQEIRDLIAAKTSHKSETIAIINPEICTFIPANFEITKRVNEKNKHTMPFSTAISTYAALSALFINQSQQWQRFLQSITKVPNRLIIVRCFQLNTDKPTSHLQCLISLRSNASERRKHNITFVCP